MTIFAFALKVAAEKVFTIFVEGGFKNKLLEVVTTRLLMSEENLEILNTSNV